MKHVLRSLILVSLFAVNFLSAQVLNIGQAPDGAGWHFTLVLTNTTTANAVVSILFYQDTDASGDTTAWTPPLQETVNLAAVTVPAASSVFLHSTGTAATLTQGWAQILNATGVQAYIIYTYKTGESTSDATAEGVATSPGFLVPFDNTGSLATEAAVVNPNPTSITVSVTLKTTGGVVTTGSLNLPANGQVAFGMPTQFPSIVGQAGLAEFYSTTGSIIVLALRSNTNPQTGLFSFTSAFAYAEAAPPIISTSGSGGGGTGGTGGIPAGDITFAGFSVGKTVNYSTGTATETDAAGGVFGVFTPTAFNAPYSGTKVGSCLVYSYSYNLSGTYPFAATFYLNAGNSLSLTGTSLPAAYQTIPSTSTPSGPVYVMTSPMPAGTLQDGTTYTLSSKTGGTQVEGFTVSATLPANFSTNIGSITTVVRSLGVPVTWTGTGFETVVINVGSFSLNGTTIDQVTVTCVEPASAGNFTIPAAALTQLAPGTLPLGGGTLSLTTTNASASSISSQSALVTSFTPNLVSGGKIKYGEFAAFDSVSTSVSIQ